MTRMEKLLLISLAVTGLSGWAVVGALAWWSITAPSPIVLEGCREVPRPAVRP